MLTVTPYWFIFQTFVVLEVKEWYIFVTDLYQKLSSVLIFTVKESLQLPFSNVDRLCSLEVRVPGCRSIGQGSIPGATRFFRSSGSGTGSTQPREYN
jgi:hypothetical protein